MIKHAFIERNYKKVVESLELERNYLSLFYVFQMYFILTFFIFRSSFIYIMRRFESSSEKLARSSGSENDSVFTNVARRKRGMYSITYTITVLVDYIYRVRVDCLRIVFRLDETATYAQK